LFACQFPNATTRFSDRVENYARYRPSYPHKSSYVNGSLREACGLKPAHVIADIASGTGIWTRQLLEAGNEVFGIEPNAEMSMRQNSLLRPGQTFAALLDRRRQLHCRTKA